MTLGLCSNPTTKATNACVASALGAITHENADVWIERLRTLDPASCTRKQGTAIAVYLDALRFWGYKTTEIPARAIPLHLALARLKGKTALLSISIGRCRHAIAASGFIVCDNSVVTPQWYADWQRTRHLQDSYAANPRPYKVHRVTIIEKGA